MTLNLTCSKIIHSTIWAASSRYVFERTSCQTYPTCRCVTFSHANTFPNPYRLSLGSLGHRHGSRSRMSYCGRHVGEMQSLSRHEIFTQGCFNIGVASQTVDQHWTGIVYSSGCVATLAVAVANVCDGVSPQVIICGEESSFTCISQSDTTKRLRSVCQRSCGEWMIHV